MSRRIILSRTDGIGDVVLSLPVAVLLKQYFPDIHISFLGRSYTEPVIKACSFIDKFINRDDLLKHTEDEQCRLLADAAADTIVHLFPDKHLARIAKKSGIQTRIGTSHRFHHWFTCNRLVPVGRKRSPLHEAQLNACLLRPLGINDPPDLETLRSLVPLDQPAQLDEQFSGMIDANRRTIILHPTSKGSAREWGLDNFSDLIALLPEDRYSIFISGSSEDQARLAPLLEKWGSRLGSLVGELSLEQFIAFIARADALVAASTGPLHIAAALGRAAVGLYAPMRPIHPGRWAPLGVKADYLVLDKHCQKCRHGGACECIQAITASQVLTCIEKAAGQG